MIFKMIFDNYATHSILINPQNRDYSYYRAQFQSLNKNEWITIYERVTHNFGSVGKLDYKGIKCFLLPQDRLAMLRLTGV